MRVLCPSCKTRYKVDENKIGDQGLRLRCQKCNTVFRVKKPAAAQPAPARQAVPQQPQQPAPPPPQAQQPAPAAAKPLAVGPYQPSTKPLGTIVVGDADQKYLKHVARLVLQAGFTVYLAENGEKAMELIRSKLPQVAILDVALPGMFGFDIAEKTKQDPALAEKVKIILLGSVYEKDRFRRQPESLYGADDYIEKHHDGPAVVKKIKQFVLGEPPPPAEQQAPPQQETEAPRQEAPPQPEQQPVSPEQPQQAQEPPQPQAPPQPAAPPPQQPAPAPAQDTQQSQAPSQPAPAAPAAAKDFPPVPDDPAHQKAARLARTIVSDISLYNTDLVAQGVKEGNIYDLLAKDISDGLQHYNTKVSEEIRNHRDYFKEAFETMIERKKKEFGLA
ncbi:MAG: zinc-ribbon domain-containing protein [bacterium]